MRFLEQTRCRYSTVWHTWFPRHEHWPSCCPTLTGRFPAYEGKGVGASFSLAVLTVLFALHAASARAADFDDTPPASADMSATSRLEATIIPMYGWVTGMDGEVGARGLKASVDVTPMDVVRNLDELIDALDGVYMGAGQIRYDKFGFAYDVVHFNVSSVAQIAGERSASLSASRPGIGPISGPDLTLSVGGRVDGIVDVAFSYTMATFAGTYRVHETATSHLDVVAGLRVTEVDLKVGVVADVSLTANGQLTLGSISKPFTGTVGRQVNAVARGNETWVDPIVGFMGRSKLDENWYVTGWALAGGFGANSDFLFDVMGGVGYEWSNGISAFAGYRASGTDYQNDGFKWDLTLHGPILGISAAF